MTPAQVKLFGFAVLLVVTFFSGWRVNGWRHEAELKAQLEEMVAYKEAYDVLSRDIVKEYNRVEAEQVIIYRDIKKEIPNVTDNRICFADTNALSLWNQAITGVPETPTGATDETAGADTATDKEVLENAVENFEQYTKARNQLNKLIDFHEAYVKK